MPNLVHRMLKLRNLVNIRVGLGAAHLPTATTSTTEYPPVTRLHLTYAKKIYEGHQGARHFWRQALPRLKYYNPAIPMSVRQTDDQKAAPALTVYFSGASSKSAELTAAKDVKDEHAPVPGDGEKAAVVDLRSLTAAEIWGKVRAMTGAKEVEASEEDRDELGKLEKIRVQAGADRERVGEMRQRKKDQERQLEQARREVEKLKELS